jgi:hypothetical protein
VKILIISEVQAFKPDAAAWPAGTRFFKLRKPLLLLPEMVDHTVMAVCCLLNYTMSKKSTKHPETISDREHTQTGIV